MKKSIQPNAETKYRGSPSMKKSIQPNASELDERWEKITEWLARLRVLEGVPFTYLVPFEEMLPNESIRFFHIDRNWLDALVDGAISAGRIGSEDSGYDAERYEAIMKELHDKERDQRPHSNFLWKESSRLANSALAVYGETLTGFLFRSSVVRHWPGIEVSAYHSTTGQVTYADEDRIPTIRQERLSESVLLCIFNGTPNHVRLQEPYEGIQIGVDSGQALPTNDKAYEINLKDMKANFFCDDISCDTTYDTAKYSRCPTCNSEGYEKIDAFARSGTGDNSVLDIRGIYLKSKEKISEITGNPSSSQDSAFLAIQMLQFPYQQDFEPGGVTPDWNIVKGSIKSNFDVKTLGKIIESKKKDPNPPIKQSAKAQRLKAKEASIITSKQISKNNKKRNNKSIAKLKSKHGSTEALQTGSHQSKNIQSGLMDSKSSESSKRRGFLGFGRKR